MLPARVPSLLVNGSSGIAVGIATRIPPHNLREVVAGLHALINNPAITAEQLMRHIPGPDFPTGARMRLLCGHVCLRSSQSTDVSDERRAGLALLYPAGQL